MSAVVIFFYDARHIHTPTYIPDGLLPTTYLPSLPSDLYCSHSSLSSIASIEKTAKRYKILWNTLSQHLNTIMTTNTTSCVSFVAPSTQIDPNFWEELYERKLNIYKLGTEKEKLSVYYSCSDKNNEAFVLEERSFKDNEGECTSTKLSARGTLVNVNTIEVKTGICET